MAAKRQTGTGGRETKDKRQVGSESVTANFGSLRLETGSARAIPGLIAALGDRKKHGDALQKLQDALIPFDRPNEATGPALRLLLVALRDNALPNREGTVQLAVHLAETDRCSALVAWGMDLGQEEVAQRYGRGVGSAIRSAIEDSAAVLCQLLSHKDPATRLGAARVLQYAPEHAGEGVAALRRRLEDEPDARVFPWIALALATLGRRHPESRAETARALRQCGAKSNLGPVSTASAEVAAAVISGEVPAATLEPALADALEGSLRPWAEPALWPFETAFVDDSLLTLMGSGPLGRAGQRVAAHAVIAVGPRIADSRQPPWVANHITKWTTDVLRWFFPPGKHRHLSLEKEPVGVELLDDEQRSVLAGLSTFEHQEIANMYPSFGLPPDRRSRRRLLGIEPPGILEKPFRSKKWSGDKPLPLWRIVTAVFRSKDAPPIRPIVIELTGVRATIERLDLWVELLGGAYGITDFDYQDPIAVLKQEVSELTRAEVETWADRQLSDLGRLGEQEQLERVGWYVVRGVLEKLGSEELPVRYDRLLTLAGDPDALREIFQRIPTKRALAIFNNSLRGARLDANSTAERIAKLMLDLHPEATELLLSWFGKERIVSGVREGFAEHRKVPKVAAILRSQKVR